MMNQIFTLEMVGKLPPKKIHLQTGCTLGIPPGMAFRKFFRRARCMSALRLSAEKGSEEAFFALKKRSAKSKEEEIYEKLLGIVGFCLFLYPFLLGGV